MLCHPRWVFVAALVAVVCAGLTGCAEPKTAMRVEVPPNSQGAAALRRVAVLPFQGPSGEQASLEFESLLAQIDHGGQGYFTVIDRRTLQNALNELKLQDTGLTDPNNAAKIGKFINVDGIYTGVVMLPPPVRQAHTEQRIRCNDKKCKSSSPYSVACMEKVVQYTLMPRLVAVATAQVIYQPTVTASRKAVFCQDNGTEPADASMLAEARAEVYQKVRYDIAPHTAIRTLALRTNTDGLSKDARARFDDAMAFADAGRMDRACAVWAELASTNPDNITLAYDLAVCDETMGRLEQALDGYTKIDQKLQRPDKEVNIALARVRNAIAAANKLEANSSTSQQAIKVPPPRKVPVSGSDN